MSVLGSGVQPGFYHNCVALLFKRSNFDLLLVPVKTIAMEPVLSHVLIVSVIGLKLCIQIKA